MATYSVTYRYVDANSSKTYNYSSNEIETISPNSVGWSRIGYNFKEWNTESDGDGTSYSPNSIITLQSSETTLYAIWEEYSSDPTSLKDITNTEWIFNQTLTPLYEDNVIAIASFNSNISHTISADFSSVEIGEDIIVSGYIGQQNGTDTKNLNNIWNIEGENIVWNGNTATITNSISGYTYTITISENSIYISSSPTITLAGYLEFKTQYMSSTFNINFTSNGNSYNKIFIDPYELIYAYNDNEVSVYSYRNSSWTSNDYCDITIEDGDDIYDQDLISYLEENAVKVVSNKSIISNINLTNIANSIRYKLSSQNPIKTTDMPEKIRDIGSGSIDIEDDGKTHFFISFPDNAPSNRLEMSLCFSQTVSNGVEIDWGDSNIEMSGGNINTGIIYKHTYSSSGEYEIILTVNSGELKFTNYLIGSNGTNYYRYRGLIRKIYLFGNNITISSGSVFSFLYNLEFAYIGSNIVDSSSNTFYYCYSLRSVRYLASSSTGSYKFQYCYSLKDAVISYNTLISCANLFRNCSALNNIDIINQDNTSGGIPSSTFQSSYSLQNFTIPESITSISEYAFRYCESLSSIVIPSRVSFIGQSAFQGCYSIAEYHIKATTPPTLENVNVFNGIQSDCKIYVPAGTLNAYQTATNWSDYAQYIEEERVDDLTNTTWTFNNTLNIDYAINNYNISFTSDGYNYSSLEKGYIYGNYGSLVYEGVPVYNDGVWEDNENIKTILITGGTDATNTALIDWLYNNATLTL